MSKTPQDGVKPTSPGLGVNEFRPVEGICRLEYLQALDKDAEKALNRQEYSPAARVYTSAIDDVQSDLAKLYSKRSNVHVRKKCFQEALSDATFCILINPTWPMGHWRMAEAHKGLNNEYAALQCLVKGYNLCTMSQGHPDLLCFMAETIKTICLVSDDPCSVLRNTKLVTEEEHPGFIVKVLNHLASRNHWEAVSLLVLGMHSGPPNCFERIAFDANAEEIPVGSLINSHPFDNSMKKWGSGLVTALLKNGASVQNMETCLGKPAVHIGINVALETEQLDLLLYLFDNYIINDDRRNAQDSNGNSGIHLLVQSEKIRSQLGEIILDLLLKNGCCRNVVNKAGEMAINYLDATDKAYWMLYEETKKTETRKTDSKVNKTFMSSGGAVKSSMQKRSLESKRPPSPERNRSSSINSTNAVKTYSGNPSPKGSEQDTTISFTKKNATATSAAKVSATVVDTPWQETKVQCPTTPTTAPDRNKVVTVVNVPKQEKTVKCPITPPTAPDRNATVAAVDTPMQEQNDKWPTTASTGRDKKNVMGTPAVQKQNYKWPTKTSSTGTVSASSSKPKSKPTYHQKMSTINDDYNNHVNLSRDGDFDFKLEIFSKEQQKRKRKQDLPPIFCRTCDNFLEGYVHLIKLRTGKAYTCLANVLRTRGSRLEHILLRDETIDMIVKSLAETSHPDIPRSLTDIPPELYIKMIVSLEQQERYRQMNAMVRDYRKYRDGGVLKDFAKTIDIVKVIRHSSMARKDGEALSEFIDNMVDSGAVLEDDGQMCIRAAVEEEHYRIICTLLDKGASPEYLSLQEGDTPLHAALAISLERDKDNFTILEKLLDLFEKDSAKYPMLNPLQQDVNGDGLFHLAARGKCSRAALKAADLLCERKVPAWIKNNSGKIPKDYISNRNDRRLPYIRQASAGRQARQKQKSESAPASDDEDMKEEHERTPKEKVPKKSKKVMNLKPSINRDAIRKKVEDMIFRLPDLQYSIVNPPSLPQEDEWKTRTLQDEDNKDSTATPETIYNRIANTAMTPIVTQTGVYHVELEQLQGNQAIEEIVGLTTEEVVEKFDNLAWEVECTADAWRKLCSCELTPEQKRHAVMKIQELACGKHQTSRAFLNIPSSLRLYLARVSERISIIWELAIAFSAIKSDPKSILETSGDDEKVGRIYSETIRIWAIVYNDAQNDWPLESIVMSHNRGKECIMKKTLKGCKLESTKQDRIPMNYSEIPTESEIYNQKETKDEIRQLHVPASSNETEYHIIKFYAFSSNLVNNILQNSETKVDYPFLVTDLEHAIVSIQETRPMLLLGRSGTGKTTCCLYRLWSEFEKNLRNPETNLRERHSTLLVSPEHANDEEMDEQEEEEWILMEDLTESGNDLEDDDVKSEADANAVYDQLHQIFVTKNAVLCSEVKKNFSELRQGSKLVVNQMQMEETPIPLRLQEVEDHHYPLFITSKKLLLMLDASIKQPYFERDENGIPKVDIQGWTDEDDMLNILPLLAESEDEDEDDEEFDNIPDNNNDDGAHRVLKNRDKTNLRREVTYEVFSHEVWPKISKKYSGKYHPSLIWTEIMSFIKGSLEALSKPSGYLTKEEYFHIGKKRASNFSGQREHVYEIFERYHHFKKMNFSFDETDLVHHIYSHLQMEKEVSWAIHQIFVDETQDFSQAELSLLVGICQNPNEMFLTGDTAQSIMRGIAFRFEDIRSIFFTADQNKSTKSNCITVPKKVYQLTHNYRSHAGILCLASSILDIMVHYFPESFDTLQRDQGLFHGPPPVLLESCSFGDIAVLLSGNKRKTSHIEFGAHQAILVVDEEARDNIPEELNLGLILTIYEAKGLEFDDILLYNFFKDSQAGKEWRVVTQYLEDVAGSLIEIDAEYLQQSKRPRPLPFDPNKHKLLNSELKHLYTAVTRARVNVWIFDENIEKRAPMFEYFKVRKLAKTLTSSDVDNDEAGGVFAESSSKAAWIKRGQDFMKRALYEVAAKCFSRCGDAHLVKVAQAHQQALVASRTKDSQQSKRDEFLVAAEKFLDCNLPSKAAKCLVHAREKEILPQIYEKTGQLERAAEAYKRLGRTSEVCRCYEQLGWYDQAIESLCRNNSFETALEFLGRYEELKKQYGKQNLAILNAHAPRKQHTREHLCFQAAKYYHETGNESRMLANLERLPQLADQIEFLKTHRYFERAAEVYYREKRFKESADLYLLHGMARKAIDSARQSGENDLLAYCLLVYVQVTIRKKSETKEQMLSQKQDLIQHLQEAIDLALKSGNHDLRGEACFLKGEIIQEITDINESWGAFNKSLPYRNEAGQLECMHWMVNNSPLDQMKNCFQVILGMKNLFGVLNILLSQTTPNAEQRMEAVYRYFGLEVVSHNREILKMYPQHRPRAFEIMSQRLPKDDNLAEYEVSKELAKTEICRYLLNRGEAWLKKIVDALLGIRQTKIQCPNFLIGIDCRGPCECKHKPQDKYTIRELLNIDMLLIELDSYVIQGARQALRNIPRKIRNMVTIFMPDAKSNPLASFKSCSILLNDLIPRHFQPWQFKNNVCWDIRQQVLSKRYMKEHILKYLRFRHEQMKTAKEKNTDVFLQLMFLKRYFDINNEVDTSDEMLLYENEIQQGVVKKEQDKQNLKQLGFLVEEGGDGQMIVLCIARRFCEGLYELTVCKNPMESFIRFTRFLTILAYRKNYDILPEMHVLLMWIEFYTVVGLCLAAKVNRNVKAFFLPASYISTVYFIDSSYISPSDISLFALIQRHRPNPNGSDSKLVMERFEMLLSILCETNMNLIRLLFKVRRNSFVDYPLAERLLVLCMTCLCNMGWATDHDKEPKIMRMLCEISLPENSPSRLVKAVKTVQYAKGQIDIAGALWQLLRERNNEEMRLCQWNNNRYGLNDQYLEDISFMNSTFLHPDTPNMMSNLATETPQERDEIPSLDDKEGDEAYISLEEKQKHEAELQELQQYQKMNNASLVLTRFFRRIAFVKKSRMLKLLLEEYIEQQAVEERMKIFEFISVDNMMCGICNVQLKLEDSYRKQDTSGFKGGNKTTTMYEPRRQHPVYENRAEQSPRAAHEDSPEHLQKNKEFCFFKSKYKREIAPVKEKIHDFVQKHQFRVEGQAKRYTNFELEIQQLLNLQTEFHKELDDLMKARAWADHGRLLQKSKDMESLYNTIKEYAEDQYKILKEEAETTDGNDNEYDESKMEEIDDDYEDVVKQPAHKPRKPRKNKHT